MEVEHFEAGQESGGRETAPTQFPDISFVSPELRNEEEVSSPGEGPLSFCTHEKCAIIGMVIGGVSLVAWVVMALGFFVALLGGVLSFLGIKSSQARYAKVGVVLSIIGFVLSILYVYGAYTGKINYNYFTSEFWEFFSGIEKGVK